MSYPIANIDGIGPEEAHALKRLAIRTTGALLEAAKSPKGRKELAVKTGIDEKRLLKWANAADRMRIKGIGDGYAELIRAAGVERGRSTVRILCEHRPIRSSVRRVARNACGRGHLRD